METQIANRIMDESKVTKFMQFVSDPDILKILTDKNHYPILKLLKVEVSTVRELEERYEEATGKKKSYNKGRILLSSVKECINSSKENRPCQNRETSGIKYIP